MIGLPIADSSRPTIAYDYLFPDNLASTRDNLKINLSGNELSRCFSTPQQTEVVGRRSPLDPTSQVWTDIRGKKTSPPGKVAANANLLTQSDQVACFHNAARHLTSGGRFVIELWVPELRKLPPGQEATVFSSKPGYIGLDTYDVLRQRIVSHHFGFGEGTQAQLFRSPHRYIWPAELDLMAQLAGSSWRQGTRTGQAPSSPPSPGRTFRSTASRLRPRHKSG